MRIAVTSNFDKEPSENVAGGSELFTYLQTKELSKRDSVEKIDLFAMGVDRINEKKVQFHSLLPISSRDFISQRKLLSELSASRADFLPQFESVIATEMYREIINTNVEIVQNNSTSAVFNSLLTSLSIPVVTTLHTNLNSPSILIPGSLGYLTRKKNNYFVAISHSQKKLLTDANLDMNIARVIHNGIDHHKFNSQASTAKVGYGLWIGRISSKHNKGIKEAILASQAAKSKLIAIASVDDTSYFEQEVRPLLNELVELITKPITFEQKCEYYRNASYFLYPIMWEEPFGLVFLESMASGTPVIAFARGATAEIVTDVTNGFLINPAPDDIRGAWSISQTGIDGISAAITRIKTISDTEYKAMCESARKTVEDNFSIEKMVSNYLDLYNEVLHTTQ
jgi:glycosyltransferase involved in cell wall biosynthesis